MADFETHCWYNKKKTGFEGKEAHKLMDQHFARLRDAHRQVLHHWEGIHACATLLAVYHGDGGHDVIFWEEQCKLHVKLDFEYEGKQYPIPHRVDYLDGDGMWPTTEPWSA